MSNTFIYGLIDPRTRMIRYVGSSSVGMRRPLAHREYVTSNPSRRHVANWVRELKRAGHDYEICILEHVSIDQLNDAEIWWIAFGRGCGWPLTNLTAGGEGLRNASLSTRAKMSANTKAQMTPEARRLTSEQTKARWAIPGARDRWAAKLSAGWTPEARAAAGDRMRRQNPGAATRFTGDRARLPNAGKPKNEETKEKIRATLVAYADADDVRARLSAQGKKGAAMRWTKKHMAELFAENFGAAYAEAGVL